MFAYPTYEAAAQALNEALLDAELDFGEGAGAAHNDIVRTIASDCPRDVADELLRRNGVSQ